MKKQSLNSFAIAVFLSANPLAWVFSFLPRAIVFIVLFSWLFVIINKQLPRIARFPLYTHLTILILLTFFIFSIINNNTDAVYEYFSFFLITGVTGIYYSHLDFSIKKVFKYLALISIPMSVYILNRDVGTFEEGTIDYGILMGISYGILRFIIALIVSLLIYREYYSKKMGLFFLLSLVFFFSFYFKFATRGAMLAILLFFVIYFIMNGSKQKTIILRFTFLSILVVIGLVFFLEVISFTNRQLDSVNVEIQALKKTERFLEIEKSIDNGRGAIANIAIEDIYESPLFGYGVAAYEKKNNNYYVHNVFLQTAYEGGILFLFPILGIAILSLFITFSNKYNIELRVFILFLLTAGIVELLFSNTFWKSQFFWFYIFFIINVTKGKTHFTTV